MRPESAALRCQYADGTMKEVPDTQVCGCDRLYWSRSITAWLCPCSARANRRCFPVFSHRFIAAG